MAAARSEGADGQIESADRLGKPVDRSTGGRYGAQPHGDGRYRLHGLRSQDEAADRGGGRWEIVRRAAAVSEFEPGAFAGGTDRAGGRQRERQEHAAQAAGGGT